jgi:DNA processing protein
MKSLSTSTGMLLRLSLVPGLSNDALRKAALLQGPDTLEKLDARLSSDSELTENWKRAADEATEQINQATAKDARIIGIQDNEYPLLLRETPDAPLVIFVLGNLRNDSQAVAVIGTRSPTRAGEVIAWRTSRFFAKSGWSIVSGLALGCDSVAHQSAIAHGAHTVAVLAHGLQTILPRSNAKLADSILSNGGALLSEYRFGTAAKSYQYVHRDRIQAGLAQGVVLVQSSASGGSLHASRAAIAYKRWLAVPRPTDVDLLKNPESVEANRILTQGTDSERASLLRVTETQLQGVFPIAFANDLSRFFSNSNNLPAHS